MARLWPGQSTGNRGTLTHAALSVMLLSAQTSFGICPERLDLKRKIHAEIGEAAKQMLLAHRLQGFCHLIFRKARHVLTA